MKPRIISASRRTDIPAFYAEWFMNRIRAGWCVYPNPRFPGRLHRAGLRPEEVRGIVFWTRDAGPLLPHLAELSARGYAFRFHVTLTGYPPSLEPRAPPPERAVSTFRALAARVGAGRVTWRYDPLILNRELTPAWHRDRFRRLADALAPSTRRLVLSVLDPYAKTRRRVGAADDGVRYDPADYAGLAREFSAEAEARGLAVRTCAEPALVAAGLTPGACVDARDFPAREGDAAIAPGRPHRLRAGCLCHASVDIGAADSCGFGCLYCYATRDHGKARETLRRHRPEWAAITGDAEAAPAGGGSAAPPGGAA